MSSGPGGSGLKTIRNMRSSKTGVNSPPTIAVKRKLLASLSSHSVSLGKNRTSGAPQSDLEQEAGGLKRIRLMKSRKMVRSSRISPSREPSRAQPRTELGTSLGQDISTSIGSLGATQDRDSSSPLNSATAGHTDDEIETSIDQNATGSIGSRRCRGVARGCKLDREVKKHGKYKIVFAPGEYYSMEHESAFADGLGIIIKHNAQIQGVNRWRQVPVENKEVCLARLHSKQGSELQAPNCIYSVEEHIAYRVDLSMAKWQAACDFIEDEKFQKKSRINSNNRSKLSYNHTSGKTAMITRYRRMVKKSKVVLWRDTHISKKNGGQFVNSVAQSLHDKMIANQSQPVNEDEEPPSEEAILESTLGRRSGYIKGMGHGVEVVRGRQSSSYMVANTELKEKLEEQEKTLEEQRIALDEQKKEMEACKEQHSQEIDALKAQMAKMEKLLHTIIG